MGVEGSEDLLGRAAVEAAGAHLAAAGAHLVAAGAHLVAAGAHLAALRAADVATADVTATDGARLALEAVVALLAAGEDAALVLEVGHADGWEGGGGVVLGGVVVDLVDWHGGVHDMRLDGLCNSVNR